MCEYSKKSKIRKEKIVERDIGREREWEGESDERCKVETHVPVFYFLSIVGSSARQVSERERALQSCVCITYTLPGISMLHAQFKRIAFDIYTFSLAALPPSIDCEHITYSAGEKF